LDFDSFSGQAQGLVHIKCTAGSYQVYLGNGASPITGSGKSCLQRMKHPTQTSLLVYALNTNETYNTIYPNDVTTCPSSSMNPQVYKTATFTSSEREMDLPVYASIQKPYMLTNRFHVGQYSDSVTVYIAF
jgi:spore coat protein U-like protein